jgi:hypothetical protein
VTHLERTYLQDYKKKGIQSRSMTARLFMKYNKKEPAYSCGAAM